MIDASDIEVSVQDSEVTLRGVVDHREAKWLAEEIAESVFGVKEVNNQLKVKQRGEAEGRRKAG
jgi:osmotically-inducible protein OsmY